MKKDMIMSLPLTFVPFFNKNDGTRMQMAMSQMRQSLNLIGSEKPLVQTGNEHFYNTYSSLHVLSHVDGKVLYVHPRFLIVYTTNEEFEFIKLDKKDFYKIIVEVNEKITKGQLLAVAVDENDTELDVINGVNLKTAVSIYHGLNYEDAIVISESAAKKLTHCEKIEKVITIKDHQIALSLEDDIYKPFLEKGDEISIGHPLAIIKNADLNNIVELLKDPKTITSEYNGVITNVKYYINNWNIETRELHMFLNKQIENNKYGYSTIIGEVIDNINTNKPEDKKITKDDIPKDVRLQIQDISGNILKQYYKYKNEKIDLVIKYEILTKSAINIGDKLANRHGNKGTISIVMDDDLILKTDSGPVDIIINTLGIPGRMNLGQIYELYASDIVLSVKTRVLQMLKDYPDLEEILKVLKEFYEDIDHTEKQWIKTSFHNIIDLIESKEDLLYFIDNMSYISPMYENGTAKDLQKVCKKYQVADCHVVYDPMIETEKVCAIGHMFWMKLFHLSEEKISARSIGDYSKKNMQPISGRKNKGGQRLGEMENWAFLAYDFDEALIETIYTKSDDMISKKKTFEQTLEMGFANLPDEKHSEISRIAKTYLNCAKLDIKDDDGKKK